MNLIAIDIGGTTIKIATWINQKLKMVFTIDTPDNLDTFYEELTDAVNEIKLMALPSHLLGLLIRRLE